MPKKCSRMSVFPLSLVWTLATIQNDSQNFDPQEQNTKNRSAFFIILSRSVRDTIRIMSMSNLDPSHPGTEMISMTLTKPLK